MTKEQYDAFKQTIFKDTNILKYLKQNNIQACVEYLAGMNNCLYVFYNELKKVDINFLEFISTLSFEAISAILGQISTDFRRYTNIKIIDASSFRNIYTDQKIYLPESVEEIEAFAFKGASFENGAFISTKSLKKVDKTAFIYATGQMIIDNQDTYILEGEYDDSQNLLNDLSKKGIKIT